MIFLGDWAPGSDLFNIQIEEDLFFVNLEGPIELNSEKIKIPKFHEKKAGPILINKTLPNFGKPTIFNLANNHFNDLGRDYAINTIKLIEDRQDKHIGYGSNDVDSQKPIIFEYQQVKIGLIAFCEKQFGESGFNRPGVACYNPWVFEQIASLKKICDYVIVSAHAGAEDVPLPLPYWKNIYRSFIKVGANLVIGHHPHVPQGFEYFEKGFICYGLGNFAVPPKNWNHVFGGLWSLGIRLHFINKESKIEVIQLEVQKISDNKNEIVIVKNLEFTEYIDTINALISEENLLEEIWIHLAPHIWKSHVKNYLSSFFVVIRIRTKIKLFFIHLISAISRIKEIESYKRMLTYHALSCQSHLEIAVITLNPNNKHELKNCTKAELFISYLKKKNFLL